jgi:hypothetical protein
MHHARLGDSGEAVSSTSPRWRRRGTYLVSAVFLGLFATLGVLAITAKSDNSHESTTPKAPSAVVRSTYRPPTRPSVSPSEQTSATVKPGALATAAATTPSAVRTSSGSPRSGALAVTHSTLYCVAYFNDQCTRYGPRPTNGTSYDTNIKPTPDAAALNALDNVPITVTESAPNYPNCGSASNPQSCPPSAVPAP